MKVQPLALLTVLAAAPLGTASNEHLRGSGTQDERGLDSGPTCNGGLKDSAAKELERQGVFKYLDIDPPTRDQTYIDQFGFQRWSWVLTPDNPQCLTGTEFAVYFREATDLSGSPATSDKLVIFLQGGGACWGGTTPFYKCNIFEGMQAPLLSDFNTPGIGGIFEIPRIDPSSGTPIPGNADNPILDSNENVPNILYVPYCDGSVHIGDNDAEANSTIWSGWYQEKVLELFTVNAALSTLTGCDPLNPTSPECLPGTYPSQGSPTPTTLNHRGVRNLSAAISAAKTLTVGITNIDLIGHSAGGAAITFGMPLVRKVFGGIEFSVFNDAGPIAVNNEEESDIKARATDWDFAKNFPPSCGSECKDVYGQPGLAFIDWYLKNDCAVRIAHFGFLNDPVNRRYLRLDEDTFINQLKYIGLLKKHLPLNRKYPDRYKNYLVKQNQVQDGLHGAIQWFYYYGVTDLLAATSLPVWTKTFFDNVDDVPNVFIIPGSICL